MKRFGAAMAMVALLGAREAYACGGESVRQGSGALEADGDVTLFSVSKDGFLWERTRAPFLEREPIGRAAIEGESSWDVTAGPRLELLAKDRVIAVTERDVHLVTPEETARLPIEEGLGVISAAAASDGAVLVALASVDEWGAHTGSYDLRLYGADFALVSSAPIDCTSVALVTENDGDRIGLCGSRLVTVEGASLVIGDPVSGHDQHAPAIGADGEAIFFGAFEMRREDGSLLGVEIARVTKAGASEIVATVHEPGRLIAASSESAVIVPYEEYSDVTVLAIFRDGGAWVVEQAGEVDGDAAIVARGEVPRILATSVEATLLERDANGAWSATSLGKVGDVDSYGCAVAPGSRSPAGFLVLALALLLLRRRV